MNIFKNKVGRPSNKIKKQRKIVVFCLIIMAFLLIFGLTYINFGNTKLKGSIFDLFKSIVSSKNKVSEKKITTTLQTAQSNYDNINLYCDKYTYNVGEKIKCYLNENNNYKVTSTTSGRVGKITFIRKNITLSYKKEDNVTYPVKKNIYIKDSNGNILKRKTLVITDSYDLVLFWGQSNMVGSVGKYDEENNRKDTRDISSIIDYDIRKNYVKYAKVNVSVPKDAAYEYRLYDDDGKPSERLETIKDGSILGENLAYYNDKLYYQYYTNYYNCTINGKENRENCPNYHYSLQQSKGTNMIPEFAKTYYELTGRKIIVVFAAFDGSSISEFMPEHLGESTVNGENYTYEAMKMKWDMAVNYLSNNGYNIANKFYVVMQGEENANNRLNMLPMDLEDYYYKTYMKVHKNLRRKFGLSFGVLNETSRKINEDNLKDSVKAIYNAQERLIKDNSDIVLGSKIAYNAFINKNNQFFSDIKDNQIHLTSASLSQIGKESAKNAVYKIKTISTDQAPHITYYSGDTKVKYYVQDGGALSIFKIKRTTDDNWKVDLKLYSKSHTGYLESYLPSSKSLYHIAYAEDNVGNTINKTIEINHSSNKYNVNNSPNLIYVYNNYDSVYFMVEDGNNVDKAYFYTNDNNLNEEKLYTYKYNKNGTSSLNAYFSVNINDFEYKDGFYYGYIKTCDNYDNCTTERLKIKK